MWRALLMTCFALFMWTAGTAAAQAVDPHGVFEERCSRCHEAHGGDFARKSLTLTPDGRLVGESQAVPVEDFLNGHFGRPSREEIAALAEMFMHQVRTGGLFKQKCRVCHGNAKRLARTKLLLRDGTLTGRYSARKMREFLARHGRLEGGEVETVRAMLEWQLRTAAD